MERTNRLPISKIRVWNAFKKVYANRGAPGVDGVNWDDYRSNLENQLYTLWNRMSSGSYFPSSVRSVGIPKKDGGVRKLGIPTINDRIAQQVVTDYLSPMITPHFHAHSYGYQVGKSTHQALERCRYNTHYYSWVIDVDIKGFFDNIPHSYIIKALQYFCKDEWVLRYVQRWLGVGAAGEKEKREKGTPQGGVISPLLSNVFMHFAFDLWIGKAGFAKLEFERYADDIVIHCRSELHAIVIRDKLKQRMGNFGLELHEKKTKIVKTDLNNLKEKGYGYSFDFLGFTMKPMYSSSPKYRGMMYNWVISQGSKKLDHGIVTQV